MSQAVGCFVGSDFPQPDRQPDSYLVRRKPMDECRKFDFLFPRPFSFWFPNHTLGLLGEDGWSVFVLSRQMMEWDFNGTKEQYMTNCQTSIPQLSRGAKIPFVKDKYYPALPN